MSEFNNFDSTFFLSLGTLLISGLSVCMAYILKSKCSHVQFFCFGIGLDVVRDVELEADIEESTNNNPIDNNQISVNPSSTIPEIIQPPKIRRTSLRNSGNLKEIIDAVVTSTKGKEMLESISNKSKDELINESKETTI